MLAMKTFAYVTALIAVGYWFFQRGLRPEWQRLLGFRPALIGIAVILAVLAAPSLPFAFLLLFLIPIVFVTNHQYFIPVFFAGFFLSPALQDTIFLGGTDLFNFSLQASFCCGLLMSTFYKLPDFKGRRFADLLPALILCSISIFISARETTATNWLRQISNILLSSIIPCYLLWRSTNRNKDLKVIILALTGLGAVLAVIGLFEATRNWPIYSVVGDNFGIQRTGLTVKLRGGFIRAHGPLSDQTEMGFVLAICLAAAMASRSFFKSASGHRAVVGLIILGVLAPQSRGGILGGVIAIICVPLYRLGITGMLKYLAVVPVAAAAYGFVQARETVVGRTSDEASVTVDYRARLLERGLAEFWQHPVFGSTYGSVVARMSDLIQGEGIVDFVNSYLYIALFAGGVGLAIFVVALIWPLGRLLSIRKRLGSDDAQRDVAAFCFASIVASIAMLAFTSLLPRGAVLMLFVLTMALTVGRRLAGDPPSPDRGDPARGGADRRRHAVAPARVAEA